MHVELPTDIICLLVDWLGPRWPLFRGVSRHWQRALGEIAMVVRLSGPWEHLPVLPAGLRHLHLGLAHVSRAELQRAGRRVRQSSRPDLLSLVVHVEENGVCLQRGGVLHPQVTPATTWLACPHVPLYR